MGLRPVTARVACNIRSLTRTTSGRDTNRKSAQLGNRLGAFLLLARQGLTEHPLLSCLPAFLIQFPGFLVSCFEIPLLRLLGVNFNLRALFPQ